MKPPYFNLILIFFVLFLAAACHKTDKIGENKVLNYKVNPLNYTFETVDVDEKFHFNAFRTVVYNRRTWFSYFNLRNNSITLIDKSQANTEPEFIPLPDSLFKFETWGNILAFDVKDHSIGFLQEHRIGIYDIKSKTLKEQYPLENLHAKQLGIFKTTIPLHLDLENNSIYCQALNYVQEGENYMYDIPFHGRFNFDKNNFNFVPLRYPKSWKNGELGMSGMVTCAFDDRNRIVYNFSNEPALYLFNKLDSTLNEEVISTKKYQKPLELDSSEIHNTDLNFENLTQNFIFQNIFYDNKTEKFIRVYEESQDKLNDEELYNSADGKTIGVIIFNKNFKIEGELTLKRKGVHVLGFDNGEIFYIIDSQLPLNKRNMTIEYVAPTFKTN